MNTQSTSFFSKIATFFSPRTSPGAAAAAPPAKDTFSYSVSPDHELSIRPSSMRQAHLAIEGENTASTLLKGIRNIEDLKALDGSSEDFDARPDHVVVPGRSFEWHGDTRSLSYDAGRQQVRGLGDQMSIVAPLHNYSEDGPMVEAKWDKAQGTLTVFQDPSPVRECSKAPKILAEATFPISADGTVELPTATNLEQAKSVEANRKMAQRAAALVSGARFWQATAASLDGSKSDLSEQPGHTLAVRLKTDALPKTSSDIMLNTSHSWRQDDSTFTGKLRFVDIESQGGGFEVAGSEWPATSGSSPELKGREDQATLNLRLANPYENAAETLVWDKAKGTVTYRSIRDEDSRNPSRS